MNSLHMQKENRGKCLEVAYFILFSHMAYAFMSRSKRINIQEELFKSLTENALDFLKTAAHQLEKSPKQSLINFAFAVEIFLKARLMLEHWSLVVVKPESANIEDFRSGKSKTVTGAEAIQRLEKIAGEVILRHEKEAFADVAEHRNKLIHFFHGDYEARKASAIEQVILEQIRAWFYLHRLLTQRWKEHFSQFLKSIAKVDTLIKKNNKYLDGRFNALKPEIAELRKKKIEVVKCNRCGFAASRIDEIEEPLFESGCLVCEASQNLLRTKCPDCEKIIEIEDLGEGSCECGYEINLKYLLETYGPIEDPKEESEIMHCAFCERAEETAIPFGDGYLCLSCLEQHSSSDQCEWCGTRFAGFDADGSYLTGCAFCEGTIGWHKDE